MSRDPRIDAYIEKAAPFAQPILNHVRERVHTNVPNVEETLKWSMPSFTVDGKILLGMAAFKAHATVGFWRGQEMGIKASQDAMGQLDRVPQRDLQHAGADLDAGRHRGRDAGADQRIGQDEAAPDRVEEPRAVESGALDAPGAVDQRFAGQGRAVGARGRNADPEPHALTASSGSPARRWPRRPCR